MTSKLVFIISEKLAQGRCRAAPEMSARQVVGASSRRACDRRQGHACEGQLEFFDPYRRAEVCRQKGPMTLFIAQPAKFHPGTGHMRFAAIHGKKRVLFSISRAVLEGIVGTRLLSERKLAMAFERHRAFIEHRAREAFAAGRPASGGHDGAILIEPNDLGTTPQT
jgi:hypothetical protein